MDALIVVSISGELYIFSNGINLDVKTQGYILQIIDYVFALSNRVKYLITVRFTEIASNRVRRSVKKNIIYILYTT